MKIRIYECNYLGFLRWEWPS